jgi:hypothetical protein
MPEYVCTEKETLAEIQKSLAEMHKKLFESNGERALVEIIRDNTEWRQKMDGSFKKAVAALVTLILGGHGIDKILEAIM